MTGAENSWDVSFKKKSKQLLWKLFKHRFLFFIFKEIKPFVTDQVIWITSDVPHAGFQGETHPWLKLSSHLLIALNNTSAYETCIIIFVLWSLCVFEQTLAVTLRGNIQNKASADQSEGRQFHSAGLCETRVREENYNRLWLRLFEALAAT